MSSNWTCSSSFWTREEDKAFENALAIYSDDSTLWEKIAAAIPERTVDEIKNHFEVLVADVNSIESGLVPLPRYADSFKRSRKRTAHVAADIKGKRSGKNQNEQSRNNKSESSSWEKTARSYRDRKTSIPWSKEEHRLFLQGVDKYGRGDWRSISRLSVRSRTPAQVASHAQKFFRRKDVSDKDRKKLSIHNVTILDDGKMVTQQVPESSMRDVTILDDGKMVTQQVPESSMHDVTILDDGKMVTRQVPTTEQVAGAADSFLIDTGLYPSSNAVGTDLYSSLIDSQCNFSTSQGPSFEGMIADANFDLFESLMMDSLLGIRTSPGPSTWQISEAAGVSLCTRLFASQNNIPTPLEPIAEQQIASDDFDFCNSLFADEPDIPTPQGSMTEQVTETAEGARVLNFGDSSSQGHPDVGANAPPTASQPTPEPVLSDVALPGSFPSPNSYGFYSPDYAAFLSL